MLTPYAGIGSRKTPAKILGLMHLIAAKMSDEGWLLRSGNAIGADKAFGEGAKQRAEIYLPWPGYNQDDTTRGIIDERPSEQAYEVAAWHHPAWDKCSPGAKLLHARNSHIVLGADLQDPVKCIIAWYDPHVNSGTAQAIRVADNCPIEIPVRNLYYAQTVIKAAEFCGVDAADYLE